MLQVLDRLEIPKEDSLTTLGNVNEELKMATDGWWVAQTARLTEQFVS
jgi:hypothetical protein